MALRRPALLVCVLVAALATMLGSGMGLPGIVHALAGTEHVCTCASGGGHASCPVCNPSLRREPRARVRAIEGMPCGEKRLLVEAASDPALLPVLGLLHAAPVARVLGQPIFPDAPREAFVETRARPPRSIVLA